MVEIYSFLFILGASFVDVLEGWILALVAVVVIFDICLGIRAKGPLIFSILQVLGLVVGYVWANSVGQYQDVAGPYAWAFAIGVWVISVILFHATYALYHFLLKQRSNA